MLKLLLCFLIGLFAGCMFGVCIMCLVRSGGQADRDGAEKEDSV